MSNSDDMDQVETDAPEISSHEDDNEEEATAAETIRKLTEAVLSKVDTYMDSKSSAFEKKLDRILEKNCDVTIKKATKKIKDETPQLTRPGCKDQFKHNADVLEHIESAEKHQASGAEGSTRRT